MTNIKPTFIPAHTLKPTFPRVPPYEVHREYICSKRYLRELRSGRNNEWDKPGHDPVFHLFAGRRILEATTTKLNHRRQWSEEEYQKIEKQWNYIQDVEQKLKETFRAMSQFVKSNEEKRVRALKSKEEDLKLNLKYKHDIETLQANIGSILASLQDLQSNISKLKLYEYYLNNVMNVDNNFKNGDEIISRYEALVSTKFSLAQRQNEHLTGLETARAKMSKLVEENQFKILGLNNKIAELSSRYNTTSRSALHWEDIVLSIRKQAYNKYEELTEVRQSCWNMYSMMCQRKGETPKLEEKDFENQLIYIKQTLQELKLVKGLIGSGDTGLKTQSRQKVKRNLHK